MFVTHHFYSRLEGRPDVRSSVHIPMVYEQVAQESARWEYYMLTVDTRETTLPDANQLNELGKEGWILVSTVSEDAGSRGALVHYYFVRRAKE